MTKRSTTISISNTKATSYGYLGPIKAMLDTSVAYLAKSFSEFSKIRFNIIKNIQTIENQSTGSI